MDGSILSGTRKTAHSGQYQAETTLAQGPARTGRGGALASSDQAPEAEAGCCVR